MVKLCGVCKASCIIEIWHTSQTYFDDCASQLTNFKCMEETAGKSRIGFRVASFQMLILSFIQFIHSFWKNCMVLLVSC